MKALTVQQPWAWAIFNGKPVENRTQAWSYRGPLAIHAGKRWSGRGARDERVIRANLAALQADGWRPLDFGDTLARQIAQGIPANGRVDHRGAIIGVTQLVDVHPETGGCCQPWGEQSYVEHGGRVRKVIVHLVLERPVLLDQPIPCRGALGLWTPPADLIPDLERAAA